MLVHVRLLTWAVSSHYEKVEAFVYKSSEVGWVFVLTVQVVGDDAPGVEWFEGLIVVTCGDACELSVSRLELLKTVFKSLGGESCGEIQKDGSSVLVCTGGGVGEQVWNLGQDRVWVNGCNDQNYSRSDVDPVT